MRKNFKSLRINITMALAILILIIVTGCGKTTYQFTQEKNGTVVQLSINPFPPKSLASNVYTFHVTQNNQPSQGDLTVEFQMKDGMKDSVQATSKGNGTFEVKYSPAMSGEWEIIVVFSKEKFEFKTEVT